MNKIMIIIGTRPEAIKMAPLAVSIKKDIRFDCCIVLTGQHKEMARDILKEFHLDYDFDLDLMELDQTLNDLAGGIFKSLHSNITDYAPDIILVQGDTTTTLIGAISSFYLKIPIGHVEAGLRTSNKNFPFPEEMNRRLVTQIADLHFAPTEKNKDNLINEGIPLESIAITGNTIIDALKIIQKETDAIFEEPYIVITCHRRDNYGQGIKNICDTIKELAIDNPDLRFIFITHPNPKIRKTVIDNLSKIENISLLDPQPYNHFIKILAHCNVVITDSGGIQEEAFTLGIPLIILRNETERQEVLNSEKVKLVGHDRIKIKSAFNKILSKDYTNLGNDSDLTMYGIGNASELILNKIDKYFNM